MEAMIPTEERQTYITLADFIYQKDYLRLLAKK
jgi:hypothetical protein